MCRGTARAKGFSMGRGVWGVGGGGGECGGLTKGVAGVATSAEVMMGM